MDEINDIGNVIANTIDNKGEDKRNFFGILRAQRGATDLYNISGDSLNLLNEAYKSNKIGADKYKEGLRNIIEATGNDLGLNVSLVYLDTSTMPKDSEGSTGSSYIVDRKNRKVLIPIDVNKIEDIKELLGTLTEEVAHGKDALEGRQDKKVAEDKSNDEEGLETLGRPANEYVKKKFGEDNNSKIKLTTDGIDLSNADVGEKVGDVITSEDRVFRTSYQSKYKYIQMDFDRAINGMIGLTGSTFRGAGSYVFIKTGVGLLLVPEATLITKIAGVGVIGYGVGEAIFSFLDGTESGQDVYYGVTNQRDKKSVNFGKNFLGEEEYMILNATSGAGEPMMYYFSDYARVMAEGEAAQRALATNMANQNQISNVTVDTNKSLNIKQQEGQNPQQGQRSQDNIAQNNKNSINKTQAQESQNNPSNQQVSKGATSNNQQGAPDIKDNSGASQGIAEATQKVVTINNKQNTNPLIKGDGTLNNGTYYVIIESSSEKIKSIDELFTKEGQAKIGNSSMEELQNLFEEAGYKTELTDASGSGGGQRLIIQGHNIGSIRSNTSAGTHRSIYRIISGNFKDDNGGKFPGKIKVIEGTPDSYHTRGNTPEKAEIIFVEKKEENK